MYVCTHTHTHVYVPRPQSARALPNYAKRLFANMHEYIHTHIRTHTHTHTYTHTHTEHRSPQRDLLDTRKAITPRESQQNGRSQQSPREKNVQTGQTPRAISQLNGRIGRNNDNSIGHVAQRAHDGQKGGHNIGDNDQVFVTQADLAPGFAEVRICMHVHMYVYIYICIFIHVYRLCVYMDMCAHIHTYNHTCIHT
jgi:hypothetical protein